MFVEFLGLPASGKTTLMIAVRAALLEEGYRVFRTDELDIRDATLPGYIRRNAIPRTLYRFDQFRTSYPKCVEVMDQIAVDHPAAKALLQGTAVTHEILRANPNVCDLVLADEGFLHRAVYLIARSDGDHDAMLDAFCACMPLPTGLVHLDIPAAQSFARAQDRLRTRSRESQTLDTIRKRIVDAHGDTATLKHRQDLLSRATTNLAARGVPITRIETDRGIETATADTLAILRYTLATQSAQCS